MTKEEGRKEQNTALAAGKKELMAEMGAALFKDRSKGTLTGNNQMNTNMGQKEG